MQQNKSETVSRAVLAFVIMKCQAPSHSSSHEWKAKYLSDGYFVLCRQRIQTMLSKCCWTWGPIWASTGSSTRKFLRWWFGKQNQTTGPLPRLSEGVPRGICQIDLHWHAFVCICHWNPGCSDMSCHMSHMNHMFKVCSQDAICGAQPLGLLGETPPSTRIVKGWSICQGSPAPACAHARIASRKSSMCGLKQGGLPTYSRSWLTS